jgi:hypothetical protein
MHFCFCAADGWCGFLAVMAVVAFCLDAAVAGGLEAIDGNLGA